MSKKTTTALIVWLLVALLLAAACSFLYKGIAASVARSEMVYATAQILLLSEGATQSSDRMLSLTADDRKNLDALFLTKDSVVPFMNSVELLASTAGVTLSVHSVALDPLAVVSKGGVSSVVPIASGAAAASSVSTSTAFLSVSLTAAGSWNAVYRFITLLEAAPLPIAISTVDLLADTTSGAASRKWKADMRFVVAAHNEN